MDGKNVSMRTFFVMSALLLTQLVWLSSLAFASPYANQDDCTSVQSEAHLPQGSIVNTEFEEDEVLHHLHITVMPSDRPRAFHRTCCGRLVVCAQIDARGCRPPPIHA